MNPKNQTGWMLLPLLFLFIVAHQAHAQPVDASELDTAVELIDNGDYQGAIGILEGILEKDPDNADVHYWLGGAFGLRAANGPLLKKGSSAKKCKRHLERAIELDPDHLDARKTLMEYYLQAPGIMGGSKEKALGQAEEILARDPMGGTQAIARVWEARKQYGRAEQAFRDGLGRNLSPTEAFDLNLALGIFLHRSEQFDKATDEFSQLAERNEERSMLALYYVGWSNSISGRDPSKGIAALENYIAKYEPAEDDPSHAWAHYRIGLIRKIMNEPEEARASFELALQLDPDHTAAQKALGEL